MQVFTSSSAAVSAWLNARKLLQQWNRSSRFDLPEDTVRVSLQLFEADGRLTNIALKKRSRNHHCRVPHPLGSIIYNVELGMDSRE